MRSSNCDSDLDFESIDGSDSSCSKHNATWYLVQGLGDTD